METLKLHTDQNVLFVVLTRPDVHNAFNEKMMAELTDVFQSVPAAVRAVVVSGEGKSFCAGGDLNYMKSAKLKSKEQNIEESLFMERMFRSIDELNKPVIGLVHGAVFGGGVGLAAVCDLVLAHEKTVFSLSEVKLGLNPSVISPFVMAKIGVSQARRLFVTGERFGVELAVRIGLVHEVFTESTRESTLKNFLDQIAANGPVAMAEAKWLIRKNGELKGQALAELTAEHIARLRASDEAQQRLQSFLEKSVK